MVVGELAAVRLRPIHPVKLPPPLPGTSDRDRYINQLRAVIESLLPKGGRGVRVHRTPNGTTYDSEPGSTGGDPPASDWFQGDWNSPSSYVRGHGVAIRGGITAGLYICHTDAPAGTNPPSPSDDSRWTLVVSGNAMGLWM